MKFYRINFKSISNLSLIIILSFLIVGCSQDTNQDIDSEVDKNNNNITKEEDMQENNNIDSIKENMVELPEIKELVDNDFILYFVNCATNSIDEVSENDRMGLLQSVADQEFGQDDITGAFWGYLPRQDVQASGDVDSIDKNAAKWIIKEDTEYIVGDTGFYYDFQLPEGKYEVTCGFYDPFSPRNITVVSEGKTVIDNTKILKYQLVEETYTQEVTDGVLNLFVHNANRGKDAMQDPMLSYIVVRLVPEFTEEILNLYIDKVTISEDNRKFYTSKTLEFLDETVQGAKRQTKNKDLVRDEIEELYNDIRSAYNKLKELEIYDSFRPGQIWYDTDGNLIQAHGGQVQKLQVLNEETGETEDKWWWVGEDKTHGYRGGIRAYSSTDLYNWDSEGIVMRNISSRKQLEQEQYFIDLYGDYTQEQLDNVYRCINDTTSVIERPKMIYNEKTEKYIIWFHADGPTETSDANYAAASAGVAISDSPRGPFKFIDRYRLNVAPEDQLIGEWYEEHAGFARDMNLFVDDDKTAYIIYSSEENRTMLISKLNDEYTYLATPVEDAVYGIDFVRLFPGAQREAPAVFKRKDKYYMVTSGATGWDPNQARYYMADSLLGEWIDMGDPCVEDTKNTTFDSQSTYIICVDEETDKYIYMGDRWNSEDLKNSRYVWLPIEFEQDGRMLINWTDEWRLEDW